MSCVIQNDLQVVTKCPGVQAREIHVEPGLFAQWVALARANKDEWLAGLTGELDGLRITGMYFPKQTVSGARCEMQSGEMRPGTIGMIHSHNSMGAFFSSTDWEHMNGQIEIVINERGEYEANVLDRLECGRLARIPAFIRMGQLAELQAELTAAIVEPPKSFPSGISRNEWEKYLGQIDDGEDWYPIPTVQEHEANRRVFLMDPNQADIRQGRAASRKARRRAKRLLAQEPARL